MLQNILNFDFSLFYFINVELANFFTDNTMLYITDIKFWLPFFLIFIVYQFWKGGIDGKLCIFSIIIGAIICDQINSAILKEIFQRPRPCHLFDDINLLVTCGSGFSFPSSHAANSMIVITIIILYFRKHKFWLPVIPFIIGVSRIFVGVHFPLDVFCGWVFGIIIGVVVYFSIKIFFDKSKLEFIQKLKNK